MLTLKECADPHSKEIYRDKQFVGFLQWHKEKEPRFVAANAFVYLTIEEMNFLILELPDHIRYAYNK